MYSNILKRFLDVLMATIGIVVCSPVILMVAILLNLSLRGNPFFVQERPGRNGRIFKLIKFRTMNEKRDRNGKLLPDRDRLTPVGRLIRSTSLDELPQLLNVLKGDMSLVGPRPLLVNYLPLYSEEQSRRHNVRPGITGWAQINGRNSISWKEKFELDVWYVDHVSFLLDLKIIGRTVVKVFRREGINSKASVTMEAFRGDN